MTAPIRGLTVRPPWSAMIAHMAKRVENRTWPTTYRGWLLIHAGKGVDRDALSHPLVRAAMGGPRPPAIDTGAVVAVARLVDCHPDDGRCTDWSALGQWHWVLGDVRPLDVPVSCRGALGLWTPPDGVLAAIGEVAR